MQTQNDLIQNIIHSFTNTSRVEHTKIEKKRNRKLKKTESKIEKTESKIKKKRNRKLKKTESKIKKNGIEN